MIFEKKKYVNDHKMCSLIFSTDLSEIFLILKRVQRDVVITVHKFSSKVHVILVRC